jgi:hypothetical protein
MKAYRDATNWACDQVEGRIVEGKLDFPESTFADAVVEFSAGIEFFQPEDARPFYIVTEEMAAQLWLLSDNNYQFFDLCRKICAKNLLADAELPKFLRIFAEQFLDGKIRRPTPNNRERNKDWLAQFFLWSAIGEIARRFALKPTRNDETRSKRSACDAMAEALTVCGRETKYSEMKHLMVHPDKERFRDEFLACSQMWRRKDIRGLNPDATALARAQETVRDILRTFPTSKGKSPNLP